MSTLFAFVRYWWFKSIVSIFRLLIKLGHVLNALPRPKPDSVLQIPSRDNDRSIKAHVYKPSGDGAANRGPRPALINLCASGFVLPLHGMDDGFCRRIATDAGHVVLDVEYRLGPEHPFPGAVHDVEDAVTYVLDRPGEYRISHLSISGFSSGGSLALVTPTLFPHGTFQSAIAFYPATDLALDPSLRKAPAPGLKPRSPFLTRVFRGSYIQDMDPRDPKISPAYAVASKYPANVLIVTGERDSSAPEAEEFVEKVRASGRNVLFRKMEGCGHAFDKDSKTEVLARAGDEAYGLVVDFLKKVTGDSS